MDLPMIYGISSKTAVHVERIKHVSSRFLYIKKDHRSIARILEYFLLLYLFAKDIETTDRSAAKDHSKICMTNSIRPVPTIVI